MTSLGRKLPYFLIIGAQKCGTSSLFYYLKQHPQLALPSKKEIHYFDLNYQNGLNWYKSFFPFKFTNRKSGEASPYYLFHPHVPKRVQEVCPKVRLIVMLRNPVDRAYSHYQMLRKLEIEPISSFEMAIEQENNRMEGQLEHFNQNPHYKSMEYRMFSYLSRGKYTHQIKHWLQFFSIDQFLFIKSETFFSSPNQELRRVYDFLEIKQLYPKDLRPKKKGTYQDMNPQTRNELDQYFSQENESLRGLLGNTYTW